MRSRASIVSERPQHVCLKHRPAQYGPNCAHSLVTALPPTVYGHMRPAYCPTRQGLKQVIVLSQDTDGLSRLLGDFVCSEPLQLFTAHLSHAAELGRLMQQPGTGGQAMRHPCMTGYAAQPLLNVHMRCMDASLADAGSLCGQVAGLLGACGTSCIPWATMTAQQAKLIWTVLLEGVSEFTETGSLRERLRMYGGFEQQLASAALLVHAALWHSRFMGCVKEVAHQASQYSSPLCCQSAASQEPQLLLGLVGIPLVLPTVLRGWLAMCRDHPDRGNPYSNGTSPFERPMRDWLAGQLALLASSAGPAESVEVP